jgi:hypothetical protein
LKDYPIRLPDTADFRKVEVAVERCCRELKLIQTMKDTLGKYPGCVHWHFKKESVSGTLEVTSWPSKGKLWITVQESRSAKWIDEAAPILKGNLEVVLGKNQRR